MTRIEVNEKKKRVHELADAVVVNKVAREIKRGIAVVVYKNNPRGFDYADDHLNWYIPQEEQGKDFREKLYAGILKTMKGKYAQRKHR